MFKGLNDLLGFESNSSNLLRLEEIEISEFEEEGVGEEEEIGIEWIGWLEWRKDEFNKLREWEVVVDILNVLQSFNDKVTNEEKVDVDNSLVDDSRVGIGWFLSNLNWIRLD